MSRRLVLASASPARARLLELAGVAFDVVVSGVDEDDALHLPIDVMVAELARRKAAAVAAAEPAALVLGCDSMFELAGEVHGKPASEDEARARWRRMRNNAGTLLTGHCLIDAATGASAEAVDVTAVRFGDPTDAEIDAYIASGEPMRVAGGFTLDGLASPFVDAVEGNPGNVIGLSLPVLRKLLRKLDVDITDLWRARP
jgi:septum formation protein